MSTNVSKLCVLIMILGSTMALANQDRPLTFQGRVLGLTDVQGFEHLTILTPRGERMQFRLGEAGTCRGLLLEGDQVRIRPLEGMEQGGISLARKMKIRRTGASYMFRNSAGDMNEQWRTRAPIGSCGLTPGDGCPRDPQCPLGGGGAGGSRGGNGGSGGTCGGSR
jgi:hypothetical protein